MTFCGKEFGYSQKMYYLCTCKKHLRVRVVCCACRDRLEPISHPTYTYNILCILSREVEQNSIKRTTMNNNIHPVLHYYYLRLHELMGAEIVHRRTRKSNTCIEVIFYCDGLPVITGRINTLPEAEACGYWVMCRPQTNPSRMYHDNHRVYQLYLSPVHPKKRREMKKIITPLRSYSARYSCSG